MTIEILRAAAEAVANAAVYDDAARKRLRRAFDRQYGEGAIDVARSVLWSFYDYLNGEIATDQDHYVLMLLFAAEAAEL